MNEWMISGILGGIYHAEVWTLLIGCAGACVPNILALYFVKNCVSHWLFHKRAVTDKSQSKRTPMETWLQKKYIHAL